MDASSSLSGSFRHGYEEAGRTGHWASASRTFIPGERERRRYSKYPRL
ncbi:hypothetical protein M5W83_17505 [Paenibacillus thiaminolyticus]|uniref:Uncharacterized protein n=1 Tax=Paenibacillus thiaminolyticus TaxID=49283 RepID=A0ABT4FXQ7_PANTH|nr:hypothetical protein [Paenibacillus thiaminolyticus]MCY9536581.1 hypothetical protein [Paenibacillus thiaminolyticus]MCY9601518.1 hypothetical protein [Paenibacillus thiaminolyticus]MCY9608942.1 hypothetical protein [Paenibacillus thiaminolyticus]MCY9612143.1 hypothetical protein [Paenibacillus thiaminolyticus]MCY9619578.1 hypothetical protein [Paenibacillus thiaminolyticus]